MPDQQQYPGVEFTPPEGTIDPKETEGQAMVRWKKVGDRYTIVAFEGEPLGSTEAQPEEGSEAAQRRELEQMYANQRRGTAGAMAQE